MIATLITSHLNQLFSTASEDLAVGIVLQAHTDDCDVNHKSSEPTVFNSQRRFGCWYCASSDADANEVLREVLTDANDVLREVLTLTKCCEKY